MDSGIYKIQINNKFYIGSAVDLYQRMHAHLNNLKYKTHANNKLQRSFDKYGIDKFDFYILELVEKNKLIEREQFYIDTLKPELNICPVAQNSLGYKFTKEQSEYMSKIRKGIYPEHLRNKNNTPEARLKISNWAKKRGLHPNFKAASIKANTGRKHTPEEIEKRILKQVKLTSDQVKEIRYLLSMGIYQYELTEQFNVSQRVICRVKNKIGIYGKIG